MELLTTKEAGKVLGLSAQRVTQIIKPDRQENNSTGGGLKNFYLASTVEAERLRREEEKKARNERMLAFESKGVTRPEGGFLTLTEAHLISGLAKTVIATNIKPKWVKNKKFYCSEAVMSLPPDTKTKKAIKRVKKTVCQGCGRTFSSKRGKEVCPVCESGKNSIEDPCGVMIQQKKGTRKCPGGCGETLFIGQHTCGAVACIAKVRALGSYDTLDAEDFYSVRGL